MADVWLPVEFLRAVVAEAGPDHTHQAVTTMVARALGDSDAAWTRFDRTTATRDARPGGPGRASG